VGAEDESDAFARLEEIAEALDAEAQARAEGLAPRASDPDALAGVREAMDRVDTALANVLSAIGGWEVVPKELVPLGLGRAAKGRTVWRLVEEVVKQNLQVRAEELGLADVTVPEDEVGPYDCVVSTGELPSVHLNLKAAGTSGRANKDDVSKAEAIEEFYRSGGDDALLCVAVVKLEFVETRIEFRGHQLFNVAWIPDIYVNPSNNNLQSSKYRTDRTERTNIDFLALLEAQLAAAHAKRAAKAATGRRV